VALASARAKVYAGVSLEAGNVVAADDPVSWQTFIAAGSLFIGLDTSIGPVLLSWGFAEGGRQALLLSIGEQF
jgi:NTE family protein